MTLYEAVKNTVTTLQAAERYGLRVKRGGLCRCPFHNDKNPSMKIDTRFHCFGCQADGEEIDFTSRLFNLTPMAAAQKLADWASSKDAMMLYGKNFAITAQPGIAPPLANVPKDYEAWLVKMDFATTAANRERVLAEWTKRYNGKTEKR